MMENGSPDTCCVYRNIIQSAPGSHFWGNRDKKKNETRKQKRNEAEENKTKTDATASRHPVSLSLVNARSVHKRKAGRQ